MFEGYYQTELSYLRDMGRAFAEQHPALAGMLAERGGDPDVERLLEGFAFVAARLRQRIDDSVPELIEPFTELLLPHFLRPTPATTIVELSATRGQMRGLHTMPVKSRLATREVEGTSCSFRTSRAVDLAPVRLVGQRLDDSVPPRPTLTLQFELEPGTHAAVFRRQGLRLHLHGELSITAQLYLWLARYASSVTVRADGAPEIELGGRAVQCVGFDDSDTLFPWPAFSPHGTRLLLEYFTLPSKFLFVDITGLDKAAHLELKSFSLVLGFTRPPPLPARLPGDVVRLHCVPAVNLFEVSAEPIVVSNARRSTLLRAAEIAPAHAEVFAVESVVGLNPTRPARRRYMPFHAFEHLGRGAEHPGFYQLKREASPVDDGMHTYLELEPGSGPEIDLAEETLSIDLVCTNRSLPRSLQVGDVCVPTRDVPPGIDVRNIANVSRPARPPLGAELGWQFVMHLAMTRRSLADVDALRSLLSLYNFQQQTDHPAGRANRARVDAIKHVQATTITRVVRGAAARGTLFRIEAEQSGFLSDGDAFLFGAVLHRVLSVDARINTFVDLVFSLAPTALSFRYHAEPLT